MSSTALKLFALILMTIDHVGKFIPNMPIALHWIGRFSAPIFVFCTAQGFLHTHSKKKYILRLYIASIVMEIVTRLLSIFGRELSNFTSQTVTNNIFRTLFCSCVIFYLIDLYRNNDQRFKKYFILYFAWQIGVKMLYWILPQIFPRTTPLTIVLESLATLLGSIYMLEGGWIFLILGVLFYCAQNKKRTLALGYTLFCLVDFLLAATQFVPRVFLKLQDLAFYLEEDGFSALSESVRDVESFFAILFESDIGITSRFSTEMSLLFTDYQWMMIGALPFLLLYNGNKGKGYKWFFYFYYPIHIILLYFLGGFMSN